MSQITLLINALTVYLRANPKLAPYKENFRVTEYCNNSAVMLKKFLQNNLNDILITVKHQSSLTGREYNLIPYSKLVNFEISIWMHDAPMFYEEALLPQELFAIEVEQFFRQYPVWGTVKSIRNQNYANGQTWTLCTTITTTQLIET